MPHTDQEKRNEYHRKYTKIHPNRNKGRAEYHKKYREKNKGKIPSRSNDYLRWQRIRLRYGLIQEEWEKIYQDQQGCCYICQRTEKQINKHLAVDHCHKTGAIRGLLCRYCNSTISTFVKDDPEFAKRVYDYLTREVNYGIVPVQEKL